jgi:serine/threonine protein kinase
MGDHVITSSLRAEVTTMKAALGPKPLGRLGPGYRLGRYEILTRLASGGMAEVYVARAQGMAGFERLVAVKVLHANLAHEQEFIRMFLDEARLAARIRHLNVVATLDIRGSDTAGYFLVMDYIEGDHLGALIQDAQRHQQRLPVPVALRIVVDALSGLAAAHSLTDEQGKPLKLVHRDVSPHNIMVGLDGVARLTDFGVAKAEDRLTHTREGQVKGKLAYMAPEHASQGQADQRADLFSMGVVLWECLTGRRLFRADNAALTLHRILNEPVPLPSSVDPALAPLDAVLAKALARPVEARFQTCDEFIDAVEANAGAVGGLASPRAVQRTVRRHARDKLEQDNLLIRRAIEMLGGASDSLANLHWQPESSWGSSSASGTGTGTSAGRTRGVRGSQPSIPSMSGVYDNTRSQGAPTRVSGRASERDHGDPASVAPVAGDAFSIVVEDGEPLPSGEAADLPPARPAHRKLGAILLAGVLAAAAFWALTQGSRDGGKATAAVTAGAEVGALPEARSTEVTTPMPSTMQPEARDEAGQRAAPPEEARIELPATEAPVADAVGIPAADPMPADKVQGPVPHSRAGRSAPSKRSGRTPAASARPKDDLFLNPYR